jgi:hypothetical protein
MVSLPGWDSIESVTAYAKWFQIASLVAGVLIAAFSVIAYAYGHRKDILVEAAAIAEANARAKRDAESKRQLEAARGQIGEAHQEAHDARVELETIKVAAAPRHLGEQDKTHLSGFLAPLSKGKFTIKANVTVKDARGYADEIAAFFNDSKIGWTVKVDNAIITGPNVVGMWITVREAKATPEAAITLQNAFKAAGLSIRGEIDPSGPAADEVWLSIGSKN